MRTSLSIDDDVLKAAKAIAKRRSKSVGEVVSELARGSLPTARVQGERAGFPLLPVHNDGAVVTLDLINALGDELP